MAEVQGKFISLTCNLMTAYPDAQKKANDYIFKRIGKDWQTIPAEDFFDTKILAEVMNIYAEASISGDFAFVTLGRRIYPTIKKTVGLSLNLRSPIDYIKHECETFLETHRGKDIVPRQIISVKDREVIIRLI